MMSCVAINIVTPVINPIISKAISPIVTANPTINLQQHLDSDNYNNKPFSAFL